MDLAKETDEGLVGLYQHFHNGSAMAACVSKELMARGYNPKVEPFNYADGSRGYAPVVFKGNERVL